MLKQYYALIKIICLLAIILLSAYAGHYVTNNHWQTKWSERDTADAIASAKAANDALTKQKNLLQELENAYETQKRLQEKHDRNVSDSRIASERLRVELDRIKALPKVTHTSTVAERANAATDRLLLSQLLGESDERAGILADIAEQRGIAGRACEREYDRAREALMK
jgi:hypothetical protein